MHIYQCVGVDVYALTTQTQSKKQVCISLQVETKAYLRTRIRAPTRTAATPGLCLSLALALLGAPLACPPLLPLLLSSTWVRVRDR